MAESGESAPKKAKNYRTDVFTTFLTNPRKKRMLEDATVALNHGLYHCRFRSFEIKYTNITRPCTFAKADFQASSKEPGFSQQFKYGDIFLKGISVLNAYINSDPINIHLPEDEGSLAALEKLLKYLMVIEIESRIVKAASENAREGAWTMVLTQHIFSKLAVSPNYVYDTGTAYNISRRCPCDENEELFGLNGDTSFGWEDGWHGSSDILISDVPILKVSGDRSTLQRRPSTSSLSASSLSSSSSFNAETQLMDTEVNKKSKFELYRVFAETITFSFLTNNGNQGVTLIPTIVVDKEHVTVHMYDSEYDVFLQGGSIQLFPERSLNAVAVVAVWLTLNYKLFSVGVIDGMIESGLHKQIDTVKYKQEIKAPCRVTSASDDDWLLDDTWLAV